MLTKSQIASHSLKEFRIKISQNEKGETMKHLMTTTALALAALTAAPAIAGPAEDTLVWVTNREANVPLVW